MFQKNGLLTNLKLTFREQNHHDRGHWHYDPTQTTSDIQWYRHRFPAEACVALERAVLDKYYSNPADPAFVLMSIGGNHALSYTYEDNTTTQEKIQDRFESIDNWRESGMDPYKPWGITLSASQAPEINDLLTSYIDKYNWLGGKQEFEYKFWIQFPGQMTMCHMDHMYTNYEGRTRWEDPKIQRKIHCMLSEYEKGQFMCWGNNIITNWSRGEGFLWNWGLPHWTANYGSAPRVSIAFSFAGDVTDDEIKNGLGEYL